MNIALGNFGAASNRLKVIDSVFLYLNHLEARMRSHDSTARVNTSVIHLLISQWLKELPLTTTLTNVLPNVPQRMWARDISMVFCKTLGKLSMSRLLVPPVYLYYRLLSSLMGKTCISNDGDKNKWVYF